MGHKSAEGIPSYIFKTKIIPKLSGKEIRWDINQDGKNRIQTVGPLFRPQNTDNPEKGEIQSGLKKGKNSLILKKTLLIGDYLKVFFPFQFC